MVSHLFYYQLALFPLVCLFVMVHVTGFKPGLPTPPVLRAYPKTPAVRKDIYAHANSSMAI
jgi:hypothetical protein